MESFERETAVRRYARSADPASGSLRHRSPAPAAALHPLLALQQRAGNLSVQQLLRGRGIQAKLTVSQPSDPAEREADQVADHVMRAPAAGYSISAPCSCAAGGETCQECEQKQTGIQRQAAGGGGAATAPRSVHQELGSPGRPLDAETRQFFEPRFGHDFSQVRVHTGPEAEQSASAISARAYTSGQHIVFGAAQYNPSDAAGQHLLAHELTHVVQQGSGNAAPAVNRDLATEPPATPARAQPDLTPAQITEAIQFNHARYDEPNTRLIQSLLGGPVTGTWSEDNIVAIASVQEEYGLHKDGKVGNDTFRFISHEQQLEGMNTRNENCLVSFTVIGPDPDHHGRDDPTHCHFGSHFRIEAQFSPQCDCDQFEYRQFVAGHWHRTRGGVVTNLGVGMPGGVLLDDFHEDADVTDTVALNYGHRDQTEEANPENHYIDAAGNAGPAQQAHGCRFRSEDFPGFRPFDDCLAGDRYDLLTRFRGEIRRNGVAVQSKFWTAINIVNWTP
jgi:hypothetical protein